MNRSAVLIFALDLPAMRDFYSSSFGLEVTEQAADHARLVSGHCELTLIQAPPDIVASITLSKPVRARCETPIKPVFISDGPLDSVRQLVLVEGGHFEPAESEWQYGDYRVCDGHDIEGNIFQIRAGSDLKGSE